jgi:hypothetical protein
MQIKELQETNKLYDANISEWTFLLACYNGVRELIRRGYLERHERESEKNYERRLKEAYGFGYSKSVVDLFNFYLFQKPVEREMDKIEGHKLFDYFMKDCNLYGDTLDQFFLNNGRYASIMGHIGILVDKATSEIGTLAESIENKVYPYVAAYFPQNILDWEWDRDDFNRPYLSKLKLKDDDGQYRLWTTTNWEVWREPSEDERKEKSIKPGEAIQVAEGLNPLNEIPFIWYYNLRTNSPSLGSSDIHEISRIDVSIIRNLSQGEEVINYGAFPMMRKPMIEAGADSPDDAGPTSILEFDPDHPESKADWLEAKVSEPVDAILKWIGTKVSEIYRASNAGGMAATEIATQAKSGTALKAEFQLLNSHLVNKATNLEKAEKNVMRFWSLWEGFTDKEIELISIKRSRTYEVENLAADLENYLTSQSIVKSDLFKKQIQKMVVRMVLPGLPENVYADIDTEIEEYVAPEVNVNAFTADDEENNNTPTDGTTPPGNQPPGNQPPNRTIQ